MTAEGRTQDAIQELWRDFQPNMERNQAQSCHHEEMTQKCVTDWAAKLNGLMQQLNDFRPMREVEVAADAERLSGSVDPRLQTQFVRIDNLGYDAVE